MFDTRPPVPLGGVKATPKEARRSGWAAVAAAAVFVLAGPGRTAATADDPNVQGVWMIEDEVALAVADCGGGRCAGASSGCGPRATTRVARSATR
jgi:hypothetical protein